MDTEKIIIIFFCNVDLLPLRKVRESSPLGNTFVFL